MLILNFIMSYRTGSEPKSWDQADLFTLKFIKNLKNAPMRDGVVRAKNSKGKYLSIGPDMRIKALSWFGHWGHEKIKQHLKATFQEGDFTSMSVVLIPVPTKRKVMDHACEKYPTLDMANSIASLTGLDITVSDCLEWSEPIPASHETKGYRSPGDLVPYLRCSPSFEAVFADLVVLIDDVYVSGSHIKACQSILDDNAITVDLGLCAARGFPYDELPPDRLSIESIEI